MKFGKEFVSQMVPEWQEAYMDYNYLKSQLKDIQLSNQRNKPSSTPRSLMRRSTLYRTFSGLTRRNSNNKNSNVCIHNANQGGDIEDQVILVSVVNPKGSEGLYETMFLMSTDEGGQNELVFFRKLDAEFNKVNKFYRSKVEEVMEEATSLNRQMDALIAFRFKVEGDGKKYDLSAEMNCLASDVAASAASVSASSPRCAQASDEDTSSIWDSNEILTRVKINKTNGTPYSTLKGLFKVDGEKGLNFRRESLEKIENQLKRAFVEFYQKLRLLKNYSFLHLVAFSKIMKKYDKVSSRNASKAYLNTVDNSYIGSSDEVTRLVQKVEDTYIKHFSNSNRSKGMRTLRPKLKKEYHSTTFSSGFLTGCTVALLIALILIFHVQKILKKEGFEQYMQTMFPLYSLFGFIVIHMVMYAGNVYYWRRYRVNYSFIFGFKQGTELGYREVLLLSTGLSTLALASVFANLDMEINEHTKDYKVMTELIPLGLVTLVLLITICPFNIIYRSSRFFLLSSLFRGFCAPLYKVTLPDFFLQDQLTSQIQALRSLEFYICYYGWGDFKQRRNMCRSHNIYNIFNFIVATIPYWSRLLQCVRRLCEDRDRMHGYNALKYFSTIVAVVTRTAYSQRRGQVWWIVALVSSGIATLYGTYWDIIVDWGLLQRHAKNRWLRDKLILPNKSVYFGAMVLNIVLRLAWLQTVLNFQVSFLRRETLLAIAASLEIIRRGIWNFFRLENEHLNNVGKYRAFKSVPLPFNYDENDDIDD